MTDWEKAVRRFEGGYDEPIRVIATDVDLRAAFLSLLEEQIHDRISAALVEALRAATARINGELAEMRSMEADASAAETARAG